MISVDIYNTSSLLFVILVPFKVKRLLFFSFQVGKTGIKPLAGFTLT